MENIKKIVSRNRYYLIGFMLFFLSGVFFLLCTSKSASFLYLNAYHSSYLNIFFIGYTNLGDGLFTIMIVLFLLATKRFNMAWQLLAAFVISGLVAQVFKYFVYSPRPKLFFSEKQHIYLIDGVTRSGVSSFPSGHTASIFALVTILALFAKNKKICPVYLVPAILVAYSRIYLSQHFLTDVLAGSLIGVTVAMIVHYYFDSRSNYLAKKKFNQQVMIMEPAESLSIAEVRNM